MAIPRFIDDTNVGVSPGEPGFLVQSSRDGGACVWRLTDRPLHTNQSHEPKLGSADEHVWCGTTDNVARYACGLALVTKTHANGRARIEAIEPKHVPAALEWLGYPELA